MSEQLITECSICVGGEKPNLKVYDRYQIICPECKSSGLKCSHQDETISHWNNLHRANFPHINDLVLQLEHIVKLLKEKSVITTMTSIDKIRHKKEEG